MDGRSVAVHEYKNISEIGYYKSLTDVSKATIVVEDIDYNNHVSVSPNTFCSGRHHALVFRRIKTDVNQK